MRIKDYIPSPSIDQSDSLVIDGDSGVRRIPLKDFQTKLLDVQSQSQYFEVLDHFMTLSQRRITFRGKNLGSVVTDEQYASIADGSFKGLFLGDYWVINGVAWRIADFDYWWDTGDEIGHCTDHHALLVPNKVLYATCMNDPNTTEGGYVESSMRKSGLNQAREIVYNSFGNDHILNHREFYINGITDGKASSAVWVDSDVDLMNEIMVCGSYILTPGSSGTSVVGKFRNPLDMSQLAIFKVNPYYIGIGNRYWLRDVSWTNHYVAVAGRWAVILTDDNAIVQRGVRPTVGLKSA